MPKVSLHVRRCLAPKYLKNCFVRRPHIYREDPWIKTRLKSEFVSVPGNGLQYILYPSQQELKGNPISPEQELIPAVVFLRASFLWIRLICAIVAEQVRRDIVDLHAGSMVQHLQILKYRLPDLIQVLLRENREGSPLSDLVLCTDRTTAVSTTTCLHHLCGGHEKCI